VAVTWEGETTAKPRESWETALGEPVQPAGFDPVWTTLGYDIADIFFVSGLSNCGVGSEEISRLRARWLEGVNGSGLLRSLARAREFKEYADQRFPSHAPFHILGLHCACA
jgi:hypothetical protein